MAVGRLNSVKTVVTGINTNIELYTSTHFASNVTVNVTNQGIEQANFTVGLTSASLFNALESDYIILGQTLKPREFVSIPNIGISSGNTLFCRASKPDVGFVAFSVFDYLGSGQGFGKENSLITNISSNPINSNLVLFTTDTDSNITIGVNNKSFEDSAFSIGISSGNIGQFTSSDYLIFGQDLKKNESFTISNLVLSQNQSVIVKASDPNIVFSAYSVPLGNGINFGVDGNRLNFNLVGIGSTSLTLF